jgi:hypothetical protein
MHLRDFIAKVKGLIAVNRLVMRATCAEMLFVMQLYSLYSVYRAELLVYMVVSLQVWTLMELSSCECGRFKDAGPANVISSMT